MKLYITRHSKTLWNTLAINQGHLDSPLTQEGIDLALSLRKYKINFDKVFSSDLYRAYHSARLIVGDEVEIEKTPLLREIDVGMWSGKSLQRIRREHRKSIDMYFKEPEKFRNPSGEDLYDLMERVDRFFNECIFDKDYKNVLIVTHGVTLCAILDYIEKVPMENFWTNGKRRNSQYNLVECRGNRLKIIKKAPKSKNRNYSL